MDEADVVAAEAAEEGEEEIDEIAEIAEIAMMGEMAEVTEIEEVEEEEVREEPLHVAPLIRASAVNSGNKKKRKIVHRTSSGRRKDAESKTVPLRKMKAAASLDLSDPSQLTMREIIRRAEAIERAKSREEAAKKAEEKGKKGSSASTRSSAAERPAARDTPAPSVLAPQVQVVDGRIVINQQSLVVAAQASTRENTDAYRRVEEDRPKLNYNSYSNRTPVERWKAEDTDLFYKALQQFGTDFELIQNLFPGRTRRQVKAKFKNEEKLNPVRLADALGHKTQDQSHHYRAIIEMLKTEKADGENEDEILLDNLLLPAVSDEVAITQEGPKASSSGDKVDEVVNLEAPANAVVNLEAPANAVVVEKVKPDLRTAPAVSEPVVSIPPESEVAADSGNDDPPASEAPGNSVSSFQSNPSSFVNPLGSYGKQTNPLGSYGKPSLSVNPLGSYAKNPLGVYK